MNATQLKPKTIAKDEVKRLYKEGDIEIILISVKDLLKAEQIK